MSNHHLSTAYEWIADCLRDQQQFTLEEVKRAIESGEWNWVRVIQVASDEKVLPALYGRMRDLGLADEIPVEVRAFFEALQQLSLERNHDVLSQVASIAALLNTIGIEPVLLKGGAYLLLGLYANASDRYMADVDMLVPPEHMKAAVDLLKSNGYMEEGSNPFHVVSHQYGTLRKPGSVGIELHRSLGIHACRSLLPVAELIRDSTIRICQGVRIRIPSPEHLVIHHIMHSQIHHGSTGRIWSDFRGMYDLTLLSRKLAATIDWFAIERRYEQHHQGTTLQLHLARVKEVLGLQTPITRPITGFGRVRRARRQMMRSFPALRWIDPSFLFSTVVSWRLGLMADFARIPGGLFHVLTTPFRASFYRNMLDELRNIP